MKNHKIYYDIAADFMPNGKLVPTKIEWKEKKIYNIGSQRNVREYIVEKYANIGPCMDIKAYKGYLYVIQRSSQYPEGRLCVLTPSMDLVGEYIGIGNARQIDISDDIAVITAREDGLYILDIRNTSPKLLARYQTIEYATGVTLYKNFAFVSCRQYGVEVVDISNPEEPTHIEIIRVGEVQSACVYEDRLYCGVWGAMSIVVVDVSNILQYRVVARLPLEGRGDGVFAMDGKLYAVTGQHRRGIKNVTDERDACFGEGNGLVVFDITDLQQPKVLHNEYFGKCYNISYDMWKPMIYGNLILSGCSSLGVFACDKETYEPKFQLKLPGTEAVGKTVFFGQISDAVTSFAALGNIIYVCGAKSDLYAFDISQVPGMICDGDIVNDSETYGLKIANTEKYSVLNKAQTEENTSVDNINLIQKQTFHEYHEETLKIYQRFVLNNAPILGLCQCEEQIALACGREGIYLINKEDFMTITHLNIKGCCYDVKYADGYLFAALSDAGIIICKIERNKICIISHIKTEKPVQQLSISSDGNYLLCGHGTGQCRMWDISDKKHPFMKTNRDSVQGPLYGENFASGTLDDGTMLLFWHRDGLVYTNPSKGDVTFHNIFYKRSNGIMQLGPEHGCDTDGKNIFYTLKDGYVFLPMEENIDADTLPVYRTETPLTGKITLCGNVLVACERARGIITVTDISNKKEPKHIGTAVTNASPGKAVFVEGRILVPAWYGGLLEVCIKT